MMKIGANAIRWSWAGDIIAPAGQAVMETTWLYAWALVLAVVSHLPGPGFIPIVSLLIGGAWSGRFTRLLPWRYPLNFAPLLPASAISLPAWLHATLLPSVDSTAQTWVFVLDPQLSGIIQRSLIIIGGLGAYIWLRGVWIGVRPPSTELLGRWLMGGTAAFVVLFALISAQAEVDLVKLFPTLEGLVVVYFITALSLISLVHTQTLNHRAAARQPVTASWLIALSVPMAGIVGLGVLISSNLAPLINHSMHFLLQAGLLLWRVLLWIGYWLVVFLDWLSKLFPSGTPQEVHSPKGRPKAPPKVLTFDWEGTPIHPQPWQVYVLIAVVTAFLLLVFLRTLLQRPRVESTESVSEERQSVWSWQLFGSQLRAILDRLLGRLNREKATKSHHERSVERSTDPHPADIRQIYRRLLLWAMRRGHPRAPATTTQELLHRLSSVAPHAGKPLSLVTTIYETARYGKKEIPEEVLNEAQRAAEDLDRFDKSEHPSRSKRQGQKPH